MGTKYDSLAFRGPTQEQVASAVAGASSHGYISPTISGLTVAYPEQLLSDFGYRKMCPKLSRKLGCPALAAGVFDDDVFYYALYDAGKLVDEYNSYPDFGRSSRIGGLEFARLVFVSFVLRREPSRRPIEQTEPMPPSGGNAELLCRLFGMPGDPTEAERALRGARRSFAVEGHPTEIGRHVALLKALDWPELAPQECEELSDFYSIYQADYGVLKSNMFSSLAKGWREVGTWR
jgi:hypothetical protein